MTHSIGTSLDHTHVSLVIRRHCLHRSGRDASTASQFRRSTPTDRLALLIPKTVVGRRRRPCRDGPGRPMFPGSHDDVGGGRDPERGLARAGLVSVGRDGRLRGGRYARGLVQGRITRHLQATFGRRSSLRSRSTRGFVRTLGTGDGDRVIEQAFERGIDLDGCRVVMLNDLLAETS